MHVYAAARLLFRWAAKRRLIDRSPIEFLPPPTKIIARDRVLTDDEVRTVFRAAQDGSTFGKIIQLLILTGQRRNQIANLRAEYIDHDAKTIAWPPDLMKGARRHTIPWRHGRGDPRYLAQRGLHASRSREGNSLQRLLEIQTRFR
jgi:integrase